MIKTSILARNAQLDALAILADSGLLRIYAGVRPGNPESDPGSELLCELRLSGTAFRQAANGSIEANTISDRDAKASGMASWYRVTRVDGKTALWDGSVGVTNADLVLNSISIQKGSRISIKQFTYDIPQ